MSQIFTSINHLTSSVPNAPSGAVSNSVVFLVKMSYVELYNNSFRNLLEDVTGSTPVSPAAKFKRDRTSKIEVRENPSTGTFLFGPHNLNHNITTPSQARSLIAAGAANRSTAATNCNISSSRSHSILTIYVESQLSMPGTDIKELRMGKLHLVDLAGSERVSLSGATGQTLTETQVRNGTVITMVFCQWQLKSTILTTRLPSLFTPLSIQNINSSLAALGNVLSTLSKNASNPSSATLHPPYRDSKLTHLLKDSLGGNSKTLMLTTLRVGQTFYHHTVLSLMYAARAKKIKNTSSVNRDISSDQVRK